MATLGIVLTPLVILFIYVVSIYNRLVSLRNHFKNAFSQIDVQLKRRYDLIPNLVETAKAYLKHERETLVAVMTARNSAMTARDQAVAHPENQSTMKGLVGAETTLLGALNRLMAVVENYPDLKADKTMSQLSEELTSTENKVAFARQAYNDAVMTYNTATETFPQNYIANTFSFKVAQPFEIDSDVERTTPRVSFG